MRSLLDIYEAIHMDDNDVLDKTAQDLATAVNVNAWFKDHCHDLYDYSVRDGSNDARNFEIVNGKIRIRSANAFSGDHTVDIFKENLPSFIKFADPDDERLAFVLCGQEITSVRGLPTNMPKNNITIEYSKGLDFSDCDVKECCGLIIRNCTIKSLKGMPKAKYIKIKECDGMKIDEKIVSRFSGTPKSKIVIL